MELAHLLEQHLTLVSPSRQTSLNFNTHLGYAELHSNPKAQSRWYQLDAMGLGHYPGQLAPGGPTWAGGLDQMTSWDPCWPQLLCDYVALWCAMNQWCETPLRLPALSPALKGSHVGRSVGSLWRCVWDPLWKHKHRHGHWRFLVPHPLGRAGCYQSLLSHFALDYWLLWWTSSHVLLFSRKHH